MRRDRRAAHDQCEDDKKEDVGKRVVDVPGLVHARRVFGLCLLHIARSGEK